MRAGTAYGGDTTVTIKYPENKDLRELIRFSADDGLIWLGESRMLLLQVTTMQALRKELIHSVGEDQARRVLTRMGFGAGMRDAELARKVRGSRDMLDAFCVGPQLHMLEGSVQVEPIRLDMNPDTGSFYGELLWKNSWEVDAHVREFGPADHPVCWMQIGYASGYSSCFMGRFILFREVECAAAGANTCRIVGKPAEEWPDAAELLRYYDDTAVVGRILELRDEVDTLRSTLGASHQIPSLIGASASFQHAYTLIKKAAPTQVTVLLLGETGVGKERFARALHELGSRRDAPFVAVNCAALPHDLIESELFGVEKGAFTGAHASRAGKFERADGGTLFLDEVGEMPLAAQAKLLRVLQDGEVERLGDDRPRKINIRLVAATNVDLQAAVRDGRFRSDLYYRLNVYPVVIPPLRERVSDIPPLAHAMLERFCAVHAKRLKGVTDKALRALKAHKWPGNVRELENMMERGVILAAHDGWIEAEHLFAGLDISPCSEDRVDASGGLRPATADAAPDVSALCDAVFASGISLDDLEAALLREAMQRQQGNLSGAARLLGLTRPQFSYRLKREKPLA